MQVISRSELRPLSMPQARSQPGVEQHEGVDTLLAHLLADLRAGAELESLAASGCAADLQQLRGRLAAERQLAGLAALCAAAGEAEQALRLWQVRARSCELPDAPTMRLLS